MTLDSLPDLEYKRVVSCKDSFHGTDVLAVSEHGAPGRRPNIHAQFVGRQTEDGLDTLPTRAAEADRSHVLVEQLRRHEDERTSSRRRGNPDADQAEISYAEVMQGRLRAPVFRRMR